MTKKRKTDMSIPDGFSGKIKKQFVIRQYSDKTIIAKYPRLKKSRELTDLKKLYEERFCNANEQDHRRSGEKNFRARNIIKVPKTGKF